MPSQPQQNTTAPVRVQPRAVLADDLLPKVVDLVAHAAAAGAVAGYEVASREAAARIADLELRDPLILSRESIRRNRSVEQTSPTGWTLHNVARPG